MKIKHLLPPKSQLESTLKNKEKIKKMYLGCKGYLFKIKIRRIKKHFIRV